MYRYLAAKRWEKICVPIVSSISRSTASQCSRAEASQPEAAADEAHDDVAVERDLRHRLLRRYPETPALTSTLNLTAPASSRTSRFVTVSHLEAAAHEAHDDIAVQRHLRHRLLRPRRLVRQRRRRLHRHRAVAHRRLERGPRVRDRDACGPNFAGIRRRHGEPASVLPENRSHKLQGVVHGRQVSCQAIRLTLRGNRPVREL